MRKILLIQSLIFSILSFAETTYSLRGRITEFETRKDIVGAKIDFYSDESFAGTVYSDKNGFFKFSTSMPIDRVEMNFIGKLPMKIIKIEPSNRKMQNFSFQIPLFEDPFAFICYENKPSKMQLMKEKEVKRFIIKGVVIDCCNNNKLHIKFSKKGMYQFIEFADLINCY